MNSQYIAVGSCATGGTSRDRAVFARLLSSLDTRIVPVEIVKKFICHVVCDRVDAPKRASFDFSNSEFPPTKEALIT